MRPADNDRGRDRDPDLTGPYADRTGYGTDRFCFSDGEGARPDPPAAADDRGLDQRSKHELYEIAKRLRIEGRIRMTREQLLDAIRAQGRT